MNAYEKMREALEAVLCNWEEDGFGFIKESTIEAVKQALATPRRNCDVGTAEEQDERFDAFCERYAPRCENCPCCLWNMIGGACSIKWAQMPYEKGGEK